MNVNKTFLFLAKVTTSKLLCIAPLRQLLFESQSLKILSTLQVNRVKRYYYTVKMDARKRGFKHFVCSMIENNLPWSIRKIELVILKIRLNRQC